MKTEIVTRRVARGGAKSAMSAGADQLDLALSIATRAHAGQRNRAGLPYILHPVRVMLRLETFEERIVGVLHDVLEDTSITHSDLAGAGFTQRVLDAIEAITRRRDEPYDLYVNRVEANPLAARVKCADLLDNMDPENLVLIRADDMARWGRYHDAWTRLSQSASLNHDRRSTRRKE